ncbi:DUF479 domain-containing protein [Pseudoalteromonas sp. MMG013]|uniref:acyl carrier protein phosphodiesterase n=1 Tax=Pseudoalteromonas sp. MMG013 TaxID=2822687 RepID=UPI001B370550|nr:ACP phosphodiesterase [Pseudoalteromonas sp. MMG013]MBQ4860563.1 DUF479 domain-containing protein [Pseudoalteromonas sp. MMG013]
MNYLAHLYFAQENAHSCFGNLLGDFCKGVNIECIEKPVKLGLDNHRLVDAFTDNHIAVKAAKQCFTPKRRRFSGVVLDVLFDHFLIKHWTSYSDVSLSEFKHSRYAYLIEATPNMPNHMSHVITRMVAEDWFSRYEQLTSLSDVLDSIALRIRFSNQFEGSIEEIIENYEYFNDVFLHFFPDLLRYVTEKSIEKPTQY